MFLPWNKTVHLFLAEDLSNLFHLVGHAFGMVEWKGHGWVLTMSILMMEHNFMVEVYIQKLFA